MKTIQTTATVTDEGQLTVDIPINMSPGEYQIVLVIAEQPIEQVKHPPLDFPVHNVGSWPSNLSLRREDMYGDDGR